MMINITNKIKTLATGICAVFASGTVLCAKCEISGDAIYKEVLTPTKFEEEIVRASEGNLVRANSTIVNPEKNLPPEILDYSATVALTMGRDGNTHVAAAVLVSDDGCSVFVNGHQWLDQCETGHDISEGVRRYDKLLLPGDENRFDIKYSQTFYDPEILANDLDGLSLIVFPIPIDISVRDSNGNVNDRILVKKGEVVEVALNPIFWEYDLPGNENIYWEVGQIDAQGNETWRRLPETGTKISFPTSTLGIFKLRAKINGQDFYYLRHQSVPLHDDYRELKKGAHDYVGVCSVEFQKQLIDVAYGFCKERSTKFSKASPIDLSPYGNYKQPNGDYADAWKCNIFVYVSSWIAGGRIKMIKRGTPFLSSYYSPPVVNEWKNAGFSIAEKTGRYWVFLKNSPPEPGLAITAERHMGILDYDGYWINAGPYFVHKRIKIGEADYPTSAFRKRN